MRLSQFATATALSTLVAGTAAAQETVTVAYFLEWPTANQIAQIEQVYDEENGRHA